MDMNEWKSITAVYYHFSKISMHVIHQKSYGRDIHIQEYFYLSSDTGYQRITDIHYLMIGH